MADNLAETIAKDFLACSICFEQLTDPVGLPCLHGFCFECLENWHKTCEDKTHIFCPTCKKKASVPANGIGGFPQHFLIKSLKETVQMERMRKKTLGVGHMVKVKSTVSNPSKYWGSINHKSIGKIKAIDRQDLATIDFPEQNGWKGFLNELELVYEDRDEDTMKDVKQCDICDKIKALDYCMDCNDHLCDICLKNHQSFKYMRDHKIVTIKDLESGKVTKESRFCELHEERVRYFCETEQKSVCPDCVGLKTCGGDHTRVTMKEAAVKQASQLEELMTKCKAVNPKIEEAIKNTKLVQQDLDIAKQEAISAIEKTQKECIDRIDILTKELKDKVLNVTETRSKEIQDKVTELESKAKEVQKLCETGDDLTKPGNEYEITYRFATISKSLKELSEKKSYITPSDKSLSTLKFEANIPTIDSIGHLKLTEAKRRNKKEKKQTHVDPNQYDIFN